LAVRGLPVHDPRPPVGDHRPEKEQPPLRTNRIRLLAIVFAGLVGALGLTGCGGGGDDTGGGGAAPATEAPTTEAPPTTAAASGGGAASGDEVKLVASDFKYDKASLSFKSGSQVKIEVSNSGNVQHNFTFEEANVNQDIGPGEDATVSFTAPAAGSFKFFCEYHPAKMTGTLTIT
jgi:plastocyanin